MSEKKRTIYNKQGLKKNKLVESKKRCEFINRDLILYIKDKNSLHQALKEGYIAMGELNLQLCNEASRVAYKDMSDYEAMLSECDFKYGSECKKRRYILR
jgi:hypothetical protein